MRGKGYTTAAESEENRITPAYAGKRWEGLKMAQDFEDHPRLCGEKCLRTFTVLGLRGSPPPMRGKDLRANPKDRRSRITPAYAGKSGIRKDLAHRHRDHPRLCGEKPVFTAAKRRCVGSPPPMRGKASGTFKSPFSSGITPAYAGKSLVRLL